MLFQFLLIIAGAGLTLDTLFLTYYSNINFGTIFPAVAGIPLLLIGIFYGPFRRFCASGTFGAIVKWLMIAGYSMCFILIAVMSIVIHTAADEEAPPGADAVIILGCGLHGERLTFTLQNRLDTALVYLNDNPDTIAVVSGGQGSGENISEAEAMRRYLVRRGIDESRILLEDKSSSTYENFRFSKALIEDKIGKDASAVFVTTNFHVFRARRTALSVGVDAPGIGAPGIFYITPNDYIRESFAIIAYFIFGRL